VDFWRESNKPPFDSLQSFLGLHFASGIVARSAVSPDLTKKQPIETKAVESLRKIGLRLARFSLKVDGIYALLFRLKHYRWTFGENQTNRRLILFKVSWVYILRRELLQGRRDHPTLRKINQLIRKQ
jgi:hypothetical protein